MSPSFPTSKQRNSSAYRHSAAKERKETGRQKRDSGGGCGCGPEADDGKAGEDKDDDDDGCQTDPTINGQW